jgi:hypothetical protein
LACYSSTPSVTRPAPCSLGLSATSQQYFSLRTNQPPATSQQYFSLRTNQHQSSAASQTNRLHLTRNSQILHRHRSPPLHSCDAQPPILHHGTALSDNQVSTSTPTTRVRPHAPVPSPVTAVPVPWRTSSHHPRHTQVGNIANHLQRRTHGG